MWENDWPIIRINGKVPQTLELPKGNGLIPAIVQTDASERSARDPVLALVWQGNHNPVDSHWSLSERPGYLRLQTIRLDSSVVAAKNTLTQRTFGPTSQGETAIDISSMKTGDVAGLV